MSDEAESNEYVSKGAEARRSPRRVFEHPIGVLIGGVYGLFQGLQLGEGGLAFASETKIKIKEKIIASFILPGNVDGVIVRCLVLYENKQQGGGFQYGVQFIAMPLHVRRLIRNHVTAKTQEEAEAEAGFMGVEARGNA